LPQEPTVPNGKLKGVARWGVSRRNQRRLRFLEGDRGKGPSLTLGSKEHLGDGVEESGDWKSMHQGNTGKNLVETPYRKPTQVGGCGMH